MSKSTKNDGMDYVRKCEIEEELNFKPHIFVETNFVHKREMVMVMALLENRRTIVLSPDIYQLPLEEHAPLLGPIIKEHYAKQSDGKLTIWGKIVSYKYFYSMNEALVYDTDGSIIGISEESLPPRARSECADNFELVPNEKT